MRYEEPLLEAVLIKRYKRFLADVELQQSGEKKVVTVHCPNTGSMKNCLYPGSRVWLWDSRNAKRKLPLTWELAELPNGATVCVNTARPNQLVEEAIKNGVISELSGYQTIRREVKYGSENSRIDILLENHADDVRKCYVEVKNVTLQEDDGFGYFPDAVSTRGQKHLRELMEMVQAGHRAVLFFCVSHTTMATVSAAAHIDPEYAKNLSEAVNQGVEVYAYRTRISQEEIYLHDPVVVQVVKD
ncbi:sugar fermentation stimulation protein A [Oleiphilus messinensis]|uniref:Sugar fermentation stimulation protein homolog n=1 Tax=Oleiphilus messinensis TaxID=141451 RepID=A0A1Y0IDR3_9GAMM|nr:DNA/RNA nuclease SfsA [Oleiphilus messinensis]ARU58591.1 sugar fermentation stimulation protein A [Oleiphilus messinensis]